MDRAAPSPDSSCLNPFSLTRRRAWFRGRGGGWLFSPSLGGGGKGLESRSCCEESVPSQVVQEEEEIDDLLFDGVCGCR